jgi:hypothetical protein
MKWHLILTYKFDVISIKCESDDLNIFGFFWPEILAVQFQNDDQI